MNSLQREQCMKFTKLQAEALSTLEALLQTVDADTVASCQLVKMEHDLVNIHNRFLRLVYLSGEVTGE